MTFYEMSKRFITRVIPARTWRNFGQIMPGIYRSGQMGPTRLAITYWLYHWDIVIGLNFDPEGSWKERFERWFYAKCGVETHFTYWMAYGPTDKTIEELNQFCGLIEESSSKRCILHCHGGTDRSAGLAGTLIARFQDAGGVREFVEQCAIHRIPSRGWFWHVIGEFHSEYA